MPVIAAGTINRVGLEHRGVMESREKCKHRVGQRKNTVFFFALRAGKRDVGKKHAPN